ncbi:MAG TPA: hypothetical protein VKM72_17885 [Thermoanaerobaculia bacterium]|nr:hypothetical protein [Thermoanaerobaculia bacterium]
MSLDVARGLQGAESLGAFDRSEYERDVVTIHERQSETKDSSVVRPREQVPSDAFIDVRTLFRNHLGRGLCSVIANCDPDNRTGAYGRPEARLVQADDNACALPTTCEGDHSGALAAESHGDVLGSDAFSSCVHYPRADGERSPPRISLDEEDGGDGSG